jgi:hypothetical protein
MSMKDERFEYPYLSLMGKGPAVYVFFRKRNHLRVCTTRSMKTKRKQMFRRTGGRFS